MAARAARLLARCLKTKAVWLEHARKESSSALLSEHHQMLKKICQDFCDKELKPIAAKCDQEQRFPIEKFRMLSELGLCGVMVPSEYGGSGLDTLSFSIAVEEISRGCASTGLALSVMNAMVNGVIDRFGTVEQKERFLPELTKEGKLACFALSEKEPEVGETQPTTAHTEGDYYVINGVKSWCSNAADADIVIVFARTEHEGKQGSTAFYVNKSTEGLSVGKCEEMMGLRASSTCNVQFNDVRVHKDDIIGTPGEAFTYARKALNTGKIGVASQSLGISQAALECALEYAGKRHSFDRPIADFQAIQIKFAEMAMRLDAARLMTWQAANLKDAGKRHAKEAAMCKVLASEAATYISHQAIQVLGGMGYVKDMPAERHYRDARITEIYEGTNEINRVLIADRLYSEYQIFD